jgi:hypothetical protein
MFYILKSFLSLNKAGTANKKKRTLTACLSIASSEPAEPPARGGHDAEPPPPAEPPARQVAAYKNFDVDDESEESSLETPNVPAFKGGQKHMATSWKHKNMFAVQLFKCLCTFSQF